MICGVNSRSIILGIPFLLGMFVIGCSSPVPKEAIVGTWINQFNNVWSMTFHEDGSFQERDALYMLHGRPKTNTGRYEFVDEDVIKIIFDYPGGNSKVKIEFDGQDKMIFINQDKEMALPIIWAREGSSG
ncbi:MAG: hypothetical protein IH991_00270 [Planctomycetes bacterium]|nr:hypothetical protein [Planctomycetota bacterium]